jgi:hypothetical protein
LSRNRQISVERCQGEKCTDVHGPIEILLVWSAGFGSAVVDPNPNGLNHVCCIPRPRTVCSNQIGIWYGEFELDFDDSLNVGVSLYSTTNYFLSFASPALYKREV